MSRHKIWMLGAFSKDCENNVHRCQNCEALFAIVWRLEAAGEQHSGAVLAHLAQVEHQLVLLYQIHKTQHSVMDDDQLYEYKIPTCL